MAFFDDIDVFLRSNHDRNPKEKEEGLDDFLEEAEGFLSTIDEWSQRDGTAQALDDVGAALWLDTCRRAVFGTDFRPLLDTLLEVARASGTLHFYEACLAQVADEDEASRLQHHAFREQAQTIAQSALSRAARLYIDLWDLDGEESQ